LWNWFHVAVTKFAEIFLGIFRLFKKVGKRTSGLCLAMILGNKRGLDNQQEPQGKKPKLDVDTEQEFKAPEAASTRKSLERRKTSM
jgi:hypothetical protein